MSNLAGGVNFNSTFAGIENLADAILIIGQQYPLGSPRCLNVRLRKAVKAGAKVYVVGPEWETTFPATFLGSDLKLLNICASPRNWVTS